MIDINNYTEFYDKKDFEQREIKAIQKNIDYIMSKYSASWYSPVVLEYYVNQYNKKSVIYNIEYEDTLLSFKIGLVSKTQLKQAVI